MNVALEPCMLHLQPLQISVKPFFVCPDALRGPGGMLHGDGQAPPWILISLPHYLN